MAGCLPWLCTEGELVLVSSASGNDEEAVGLGFVMEKGRIAST